MKFIFPQNYNFKSKFLGIIDYSTIVANLIWSAFIFILINLFFTSLNIKIFIFTIFCLPLILFSFFGFNGENIIYFLSYLLKFILKQKLFFTT